SLALLFRRMTLKCERKRAIQPVIRRAHLVDQASRKPTGLLVKESVVEKVERLYGCDGAVPHGRRRIAIRAVEGLEERQRVESRGHEVNAPPVTGIGILKGMMLR